MLKEKEMFRNHFGLEISTNGQEDSNYVKKVNTKLFLTLSTTIKTIAPTSNVPFVCRNNIDIVLLVPPGNFPFQRRNNNMVFVWFLMLV